MVDHSDGITFIHSYLVKPTDDEEESPPIGTPVPLSGDLYAILSGVFDKSANECKIEVIFRKSETGDQYNDVRQTLIDILEAPSEPERGEVVHKLALRLLNFTNGVTGPGLLFVIGGVESGHSKIMISRFPADEGIMADDQDGKLTVSFVDKLFMKNRNSYKAVVFHRLSPTSTRRSGTAVDKQVNDTKSPSSRYWIEDFLACELAVTPQAGSERFATALREVYNSTDDLEDKMLLAAAARTLQNFGGQKHTPSELLGLLNLPDEFINAVEKKLGPHAMAETFELNVDYFKSSFRYQSKLLHTGVMITAEVQDYEEVVHEKEVGDETEITTRGRIINSKVQKTRANGAM
ncbi:hypothetical protein [uncultured Hyphomonas sp.]|uniref:hypothetical protein n=1 Tax=uncultured Hyphomonas sp. TaxID=225298 RepID=UPI002AAB4D61|nr:hypothetical protein [uncultured Hyphomonas sp.]